MATSQQHPLSPTLSMPSQRVVLVSLCAVGLLVGAFAAPVGAPPTPTDPTFDPREDFDDTEDGIDDGPGSDPAASTGCTVALSNRPVAGQPVRLTVSQDGEPATGLAVFMNGELEGRTNDRGRITTTVPYASELRVAVVGPVTACQFELAPPEDEATQRSLAPLARGGTAGWFHPNAPLLAVIPHETADGEGTADSTMAQQADPARETENSTYDVYDYIRLQRTGEAYPGNEITLNATIQGNPVPDATVTVNGDAVGTTDDHGQYTLTVPQDARELTVAVERGELRETDVIDVTRPTIDVSTPATFPTPGDNATVTLSFATRPMTGVPVQIGQSRLGTTDEDGTLQVYLPAAVHKSIRAETAKGSAAQPLAFVYAPTAFTGGFLTFVLGAVTLLAYSVGLRRRAVSAGASVYSGLRSVRRGDLSTGARRWLARLGSAVSLALSGLVGYQLAGELGGVYGLAAGVALATFVFVTVRPAALSGTVMDLASAIETSTGRLRRFLARLLAALNPLPGSLHRGIGAAWTRVRRAVGSPRTIPRRLWVALLLAGALLRSLPARLRPSRDGGEEAPPAEPGDPSSSDGPADPELLTVREYWRLFARRVAPRRWPTRTPAELARAAVEAGYSREPVTALTAAFREIEYGEAARSPDRKRRVKIAFEALAEDGPTDRSTSDEEVPDS
jgi:hypothetical protein